MEIWFLHERFTENYPKPLMDHTQRMASGETAFFLATLSLVYDRLVKKECSKGTPLDSVRGFRMSSYPLLPSKRRLPPPDLCLSSQPPSPSGLD